MSDRQRFDDALPAAESCLLAWDLNVQASSGDRALACFDLRGGGARMLDAIYVPDADRETVSDHYRARGYQVGQYDSLGAPLVWYSDDDIVTVYDRGERLLDARDGVLRYPYDKSVAAAEVSGFVTYIDSDYVDRGIKAILHAGPPVTVLFDLSSAAMGDPTYGRNQMLMDTEWCIVIARALANWAGVTAKGTILD